MLARKIKTGCMFWAQWGSSWDSLVPSFLSGTKKLSFPNTVHLHAAVRTHFWSKFHRLEWRKREINNIRHTHTHTHCKKEMLKKKVCVLKATGATADALLLLPCDLECPSG